MSKLLNNLTFWVLLAAILGYCLASVFGNTAWPAMDSPPAVYAIILMLKGLFLSLLKMLVAPIVFFSLMGGLLSLGDSTRLKRLGGLTIVYYLCTTFIAISLGLFVVFFIHPWVGNVEQLSVTSLQQGGDYIAPGKFIDSGSDSIIMVLDNILRLAFTNPFTALSELNILGIATNAFLLGLAMVLVLPASSPLITAVHHINDVLHKVLKWVVNIAPIGIFAIIFDITLRSSGGLFNSLLSFSLVVIGATLVHGLIVLPLIARLFAGVGPAEFFSKAGKPMLVAFATSSSAATLPVSIQTAEDDFNVSESVTGFVFPLGATMNMDGTALFEGIAAVFLAYLFGIELTTTMMVAVFLMAMISSVGAPGMPSGSMAGMQMVLLAAGIPLEAIGILLVVERLLDTIRTSVNVEGDMVGALVVNRFMQKD